jgi:cell division transport system permease protein
MKKRRLGQTGSWSVIFTIALALFNLGLFGILLISGNQLSRMIRQNFEVQIFMQQNFDQGNVKYIVEKLKEKPFVAKNKEGKPEVTFTSKEDAGKKFMKETGEDFSQFLGHNPLRDAFSVKIQEGYLEENQLKAIKQELNALQGAFEVIYVESLVETIQQNLTKISIIFMVISCLLLIAVIWLIRNTIKLSVYAQRFLIRSMVLVGAEPWFVQKPFVLKMIRQGFLGGILASIVLLIGLQISAEYYPPLKLIYVPEQIGILLLILMAMGSLLGGVSTWLSVRKFVFQKLDDLHFYG